MVTKNDNWSKGMISGIYLKYFNHHSLNSDILLNRILVKTNEQNDFYFK